MRYVLSVLFLYMCAWAGPASGAEPEQPVLTVLFTGEAHGALLHFLASRQARGARVVLVITGKGARNGDPFAERGVLKRMVPLWLGLPEFRSLVVGFESAAIGHGGEGALYITLRRSR